MKPKDPKFKASEINSYEFADDGVNNSAIKHEKGSSVSLLRIANFLKKLLISELKNYLTTFQGRQMQRA